MLVRSSNTGPEKLGVSNRGRGINLSLVVGNRDPLKFLKKKYDLNLNEKG